MSHKRGEVNARVREYLRRENFRPSDRLPGEREMAQALEIGRTALRPILEELVRAGVLERRPQAGTFLKSVPTTHAREARVVLIAPFSGTGEAGREADAGWLHRVVSAFERVSVPAHLQLQIKDQTPHRDDPCSIKTMACAAAHEGAHAVVLLHPLGARDKISCALALLHDLGVQPLVVSSRTYPGLASHVYFDSGWGAYVATRHLLTLGHRRIGFAGAPGGHQWVQERITGYTQALNAADITRQARWIWKPASSERLPMPQDGADAFKHFFSLPKTRRPTAIVAANDVVALGLLDAAHRQGLSIPADLSIVGFDNNPGALLAGLTTIERPTEALGEAIARVTLERLAEGPQAAAVTHRLRPILIERATAGPLSKQKEQPA